MIVDEGTCPLCSGHSQKIAEFVNDKCVNPSCRVEYHVCRPCKKVWEWTISSLGTEIVDLRIRKRKMHDEIGSAS
jgi:hypothetical protein